MNIKYWADTSAILHHSNQLLNEKVLVSTITIQELEHIKTKDKESDRVKAEARKAVRTILEAKKFDTVISNNRKINKLIRKYNFLDNINDHRILCAAEIYGAENNVTVQFITCDALQYIFAQKLPHLCPQLIDENEIQEEWTGWKNYYPTEEQLSELYSDMTKNILGCKLNEFAKIYVEGQIRDVLCWTGTEYRKLKYKNFTAPTGECISPRNLEQKMYLDLLQNDNLPIKLCIGRFGTGKSMFAETWAAHQLQMGKFDKIVFVKNNLEVKGAGKLGILPGDEIDKQYPWLRQIEDHLGPQLFEQYIREEKIEPAHLATLRGRDLKNCLVLVDEAENLLTTNIQLLLGRVGDGSQIIFCADVKQCDYKDSRMSGIPKLIECFAGQPLFGMVKLTKTERSAVAATADLLD